MDVLALPALSGGPGDDAVDGTAGDPVSDDCETTDPPYLDGELRITGDARQGSQLQLSLPPNIGGDGTATLRWERCYETVAQCVPVGDPDATTYTPTSADVGSRLRAWYLVENALGADWVESEATDVIAPRLRLPPTPRPPRPRPAPRAPTSHVDPLKLTIPPFVAARKPSFAVRNGRPIVDTGRTMSCPGVKLGPPTRLHISARPAGASAHWRGRPAVAGESGMDVAAGAGTRVRLQLGTRAYRLLRAHRKLTLSVSATVIRSHSAPVKATFVFTIKAPSTRRR